MEDECWDCYYYAVAESRCKKNNSKVNGGDAVCKYFLDKEILCCEQCIYSKEDSGKYRCEKKNKTVKSNDLSCECFLIR